jgi:hypothetical protein
VNTRLVVAAALVALIASACGSDGPSGHPRVVTGGPAVSAQVPPVPTPTVAATTMPALPPIPTVTAIPPVPTATSLLVGNLVVSPADLARDQERFVHRVPLSDADQGVRDRLIEALRRSLGVASRDPVEGVIYQDAGVEVDYISGPDDFEAEILTTDFDLVKRTVEAFLARQGLSGQGICDLPLSYSVNGKLRESLPSGTHFDPNPLACG